MQKFRIQGCVCMVPWGALLATLLMVLFMAASRYLQLLFLYQTFLLKIITEEYWFGLDTIRLLLYLM